jgi:V/A-type H+-transporting ATPase subunit D
MIDVTPTRAALLELRDEQGSLREGYAFLDEKRLLLAAEMLRELRRYEAGRARFEQALAAAAQAQRAALARHGLDGLQVYPAAAPARVALVLGTQSLLGVRLQQARLELEPGVASAPEQPSPEAEICRRAFAAVLAQAAPLAAMAGNLERLAREYRRTERRARALEGVLLPETDRRIAELETRLEEAEQEEAIRVRRRWPGSRSAQ